MKKIHRRFRLFTMVSFVLVLTVLELVRSKPGRDRQSSANLNAGQGRGNGGVGNGRSPSITFTNAISNLLDIEVLAQFQTEIREVGRQGFGRRSLPIFTIIRDAKGWCMRELRGDFRRRRIGCWTRQRGRMCG